MISYRRTRRPGRVPAAPGYHQGHGSPRRAVIFLASPGRIVALLYPDPGMLLRSIRNTARPQIQPEAVAGLARRLPDDPRAIEAYVLDRQVPYSYDWQSAGVPWYFPTTAEALRAGRGDCESRAVVLASILTAKGIPNELRLSFDHIWVDYPGKQANALENAGVAVRGDAGRALLHPLARGLPAGTGDPGPARDLLDAGAGVARAAPVRRPLAHRALERARAAARRRPARRGRAAAGPAAASAPAAGSRRPRAGTARGAPARSRPPQRAYGCDTLFPHPDVRLKESS